MRFEFFIPGTPVAQSRPRFARRGNHAMAYDAAPARDYKAWVRACAVQAMGETAPVPRDIPLGIRVEIFLARPKSRTPKRYPLPTVKPDCDNVLKGIQDALESICYMADQQIVSATVTKRYATTPGVSVWLWDESL